MKYNWDKIQELKEAVVLSVQPEMVSHQCGSITSKAAYIQISIARAWEDHRTTTHSLLPVVKMEAVGEVLSSVPGQIIVLSTQEQRASLSITLHNSLHLHCVLHRTSFLFHQEQRPFLVSPHYKNYLLPIHEQKASLCLPALLLMISRMWCFLKEMTSLGIYFF